MTSWSLWLSDITRRWVSFLVILCRLFSVPACFGDFCLLLNYCILGHTWSSNTIFQVRRGSMLYIVSSSLFLPTFLFLWLLVQVHLHLIQLGDFVRSFSADFTKAIRGYLGFVLWGHDEELCVYGFCPALIPNTEANRWLVLAICLIDLFCLSVSWWPPLLPLTTVTGSRCEREILNQL